MLSQAILLRSQAVSFWPDPNLDSVLRGFGPFSTHAARPALLGKKQSKFEENLGLALQAHGPVAARFSAAYEGCPVPEAIALTGAL